MSLATNGIVPFICFLIIYLNRLRVLGSKMGHYNS